MYLSPINHAGLWEGPLWTSRPRLHLQAFGGSGITNERCSQFPVGVFVITFCLCGWGCACHLEWISTRGQGLTVRPYVQISFHCTIHCSQGPKSATTKFQIHSVRWSVTLWFLSNPKTACVWMRPCWSNSCCRRFAISSTRTVRATSMLLSFGPQPQLSSFH